jgi:hypothetical protein
MQSQARSCVFLIELLILQAFHQQVNPSLSNRCASLELPLRNLGGSRTPRCLRSSAPPR